MSDGVARRGFDVDLRDGQVSEAACAQVLLRARVEVKRDEAARRTGNVFIEYAQHGRPSGLATTEAEWWCFDLCDDTFILVRTSRLRMLARAAFRAGKRKRGGDFNAYDGVVLPLTAFLPSIRLLGAR